MLAKGGSAPLITASGKWEWSGEAAVHIDEGSDGIAIRQERGRVQQCTIVGVFNNG